MLPVKHNAGFSIIELMVAVLILAFGLTGLAGLLTTGLRTNQGAYLRTVATQLGYDMADRMRANPRGVLAGTYDKGAASNADCRGNTCSTDELIGYDLAQWNAALAARLPGGTGIICIDSTPDTGNAADPTATCDGVGPTYAIKIWWNDDRSGATTQGISTYFTP